MKPFDVEVALKLANKDLTPYTDLKIRDLRRALRLACAEIKHLRAEYKKLDDHHTKVCDDRLTIWEQREQLKEDAAKSEVVGSQNAYEGVLMQMKSLTESDWTLEDFKKWLELKIYRCKAYIKTGAYK